LGEPEGGGDARGAEADVAGPGEERDDARGIGGHGGEVVAAGGVARVAGAREEGRGAGGCGGALGEERGAEVRARERDAIVLAGAGQERARAGEVAGGAIAALEEPGQVAARASVPPGAGALEEGDGPRRLGGTHEGRQRDAGRGAAGVARALVDGAGGGRVGRRAASAFEPGAEGAASLEIARVAGG